MHLCRCSVISMRALFCFPISQQGTRKQGTTIGSNSGNKKKTGGDAVISVIIVTPILRENIAKFGGTVEHNRNDCNKMIVRIHRHICRQLSISLLDYLSGVP